MTRGGCAGFSIFVMLLIMPSRLWACEPCADIWNVEKTAQQADAVIIGQKIAEQRPDSPEWIDVRVLRVLKGNVPDQHIRIASWYGMCSYGIVIDEHTYVMLLVGSDKSQGRAYYDAVNYGCAVTTLPVQDDAVTIGDETIPLSALAARLGL